MPGAIHGGGGRREEDKMQKGRFDMGLPFYF
jgi:hypothetical protein